MNFRTKAVIRTVDEWTRVYEKTRGGDGFPYSPVCDLPCLVLEADNHAHIGPSPFQDKAYIFLSAKDITALFGQNVGWEGATRCVKIALKELSVKQ